MKRHRTGFGFTQEREVTGRAKLDDLYLAKCYLANGNYALASKTYEKWYSRMPMAQRNELRSRSPVWMLHWKLNMVDTWIRQGVEIDPDYNHEHITQMLNDVEAAMNNENL